MFPLLLFFFIDVSGFDADSANLVTGSELLANPIAKRDCFHYTNIWNTRHKSYSICYMYLQVLPIIVLTFAILSVMVF